MNINDPAVKRGLFAILFYASFLFICYVLEKTGPSGPCNPGLGFLAFLLLPWIIAALIVINAVKIYRGKKENRQACFIHLGALIFYVIFFYCKIS